MNIKPDRNVKETLKEVVEANFSHGCVFFEGCPSLVSNGATPRGRKFVSFVLSDPVHKSSKVQAYFLGTPEGVVTAFQTLLESQKQLSQF